MSSSNGLCDGMLDCEYLPRWHLEHRGFTPTFALSCNEHLASQIKELIDQNFGGVVVVHGWG